MMKKTMALLVSLVMIFSLCACGGQGAKVSKQQEESAIEQEALVEESVEEQVETSEEIIVTDMIGREVTVVPGSYQRVVCIGAGALRMYSYIGDVNLLCGVEDIDNTTLAERPMMFDSVARPYVIAYEEVFQTLPSCGVGGPMAQAAEAEKILVCNPDIVISEFEDVEKEDALQEQLGVPVITLSAGAKGVFDEAFVGSMELLGTIFEEEEKAASLIAFVETEADEIRQRTETVAEEDKLGVYLCGLGNWGTTNHLMTAENFVCLNLANVKNVLSDTGIQGIGPIEEEKFVSLGEEMDMMIMDAAAVKNIAPLYAENPNMFDTCKAWQNGEVYLEMAYNAYYTNFEIQLINTWFIGKAVYPELFEDIDMVEKTNEVTRAFFNQDLAEEIFAYPSSFGGYQKIDTETFLVK